MEFGGTSVSSLGFDHDSLLGPELTAAFGPEVAFLIDDLKYTDLVGRGYLHLHVTTDQVIASHRFVTAVDSTDYSVDTAKTATFIVDREDFLLS